MAQSGVPVPFPRVAAADRDDVEPITALAQRVAMLQQTLRGPQAGFRAALDEQLRAAVPQATGATLLPPLQGVVTSGFGPRVHPITGEHRPHSGVDLAARAGTPIRAAAAGVVTFAGPRGAYGNLVIVDHGDGLETRYAHQERIDVEVGERVAAGALIGMVGSTGRSTGPHLHFEVRRDGEAVDPAPYAGLGG